MTLERKHCRPWHTPGLYLSLTVFFLGAQAHAAMHPEQPGEASPVQADPLVFSSIHRNAAGSGEDGANQIASTSAAVPSGQEERAKASPARINPSTDDLFGTRGGFLHPFFGIREEYTDNVYNIQVDQVENFLTTVSTGVWLSAPRLNEIPFRLATHNTAVGGLRYSIPGSGSFERFQTYLLGAMDYKTFSTASDLDFTAWRLEGMYQQNLPIGISFRFMDRYSRDRDRFDMGSFQLQDFTVEPGSIAVRSSPSQLRKYLSNQALFSTNIELGGRFSAMFNFINFLLDYEEEDDGWLDRSDNSLGLTLSYTYSPKTSFFVEYDRAALAYETDTANDSDNSFFFAGINWQGSAKTSLMAKGGYQSKQYDIEDLEELDAFAMEAQLNYLITDKSKIEFRLYRALEETDSLRSRGRETMSSRLHYEQRFTSRIQGGLELAYEQNDYEGFARAAGFPGEEARKDTRYLVRPALHYFFRDWLVAELSYAFEDRNSSDDFYDFTSQTFFLSLDVAF